MSETASTGTESAAETSTTEGTTTAPATPAITTVDQLPDFAKTMISDLRSEAAKHRTAKVEAAEAAKTEVTRAFEAKLAESNTAHEATKDELAKASLNLGKVLAAVKVGVPTDRLLEFASLLQGSNDAELTAHAEKVKGLIGIQPAAAVDPSVGQSGGAGAEGADFSSFVLSMLNK